MLPSCRALAAGPLHQLKAHICWRVKWRHTHVLQASRGQHIAACFVAACLPCHMWMTCDVCTAGAPVLLPCRPAMGRRCQSQSGRPRYGAPSRQQRACLSPSCAGRCASTLPGRCRLHDKGDACLTSHADASLPPSIEMGLADARMPHARQLLLPAWVLLPGTAARQGLTCLTQADCRHSDMAVCSGAGLMCMQPARAAQDDPTYCRCWTRFRQACLMGGRMRTSNGRCRRSLLPGRRTSSSTGAD